MTNSFAHRSGRHSRFRLSPLAAAIQAAAAVALLGGDATAQELEEIVVTTRFREEPLQQVPLAISAISAEALAANAATNVIDVGRWAPNVTLDHLGSGWGPTLAANIRGLGYGDFKATSEPTVTIYVDDVVLGRPTGAVLDLLDLERVEVLRGPQGTLFGKNAIGGVVRLISRRPTGDAGGNLEVTVGEYNRLDLRGSFETALVEDRVFTRIAYASKRREGWQDNVDFTCQMIANGTPELAGIGDGIGGWDAENNSPILVEPGSPADNAFSVPTRTSARGTDKGCVVGRFGDENVQAARATLRFLATDQFEINITGDLTDQSATSPPDWLEAANPDVGLATLYNSLVAMPNWGVPWDERFVPPNERINYSGFNDPGVDGGIETPNMNDVRHWGVSTSLEWRLNELDVALILARREFDAQFGRDSDASPLPVNHTLDTLRNQQDTAELRVSGLLFGDRTQWTAGAFYFDADDFNSNISVLMPCLFPTACIDRVDTQTTENVGVFLHTVTRLTDDLSLTVGLRRSRDEKNTLQERFDRNGNLCCGFEDPLVVRARSTKTDPMFSLAYDLNENMMLWGTYQEGFRGGGTTARPTGTTRVPFGPESLVNREIGFKSDWLNRRLRLNTSLYRMTYRDLQQGAAGQDELGQPAWLTVNAGKALIRGFEIELQSTIGQRWFIDATVGHIDFQFKDLGLASPEAREELGLDPGGALSMDSVPGRTPDYTASLGWGYFSPLPGGGEIRFRHGMTYRDDVYFGENLDPLTLAPSHTLHNARVAWLTAGGDWELSVFGTNLTNERAIQSKLNFLDLFGSLQTTFVRPREYGMTIRRSF